MEGDKKVAVISTKQPVSINSMYLVKDHRDDFFMQESLVVRITAASRKLTRTCPQLRVSSIQLINKLTAF